jgi:Protein of unknown function (DUF1524)
MTRLAFVLAVLAALVLGCAAPVPVPSFPPSGAVGVAAAPAAPSPSEAAVALAALPVKGRAAMTGGPLGDYTRAQFSRGWEDPDRNGCDARRDALSRQAVRDVVRAGTHNCILTAVVTDPYTGADIPSTGADIDHVVALGNAWATGAQQITAAQREALANDPANLLAVSASLNRSKGDGDAATWLPPRPDSRCPYVATQIQVKHKYGLWVTAAERDAMARVLSNCPAQTLPPA